MPISSPGKLEGSLIAYRDLLDFDAESERLATEVMPRVQGAPAFFVQAESNFFDNFEATIRLANSLGQKMGERVDVFLALDDWRLRDASGYPICIVSFNELDLFTQQALWCPQARDFAFAILEKIPRDQRGFTRIRFKAQVPSNSNEEMLNTVRSFASSNEYGLLVSVVGNPFLAKRLSAALQGDGEIPDNFVFELLNQNSSDSVARVADALSLVVNRMVQASGNEDFHSTAVYKKLAQLKWRLMAALKRKD